MTDPKPELGPAAIKANISYYHAQLDCLDLQRDLIKESLDYWLNELQQLKAVK